MVVWLYAWMPCGGRQRAGEAGWKGPGQDTVTKNKPLLPTSPQLPIKSSSVNPSSNQSIH